MPGFMGLRGLERKNAHEMEKARREEQEQRAATLSEKEKRSLEKVQEILRDQTGDMSAYNAGIMADMQRECIQVANQPISKIMSGRVAVLSFDDTLLTIQGIFSSVKFRHLPVVDETGGIIGIISDRDVLRMSSPFYGTINEQTRDKEIMARKAGVIMTRNPTCVGMDTTILEAVTMMTSKKISCLPVVENGSKKLLGIVTWKDIVRAFCPSGFNPTSESHRMKTGVHINPESAENSRLREKSAESARLRAQSAGAAQPSPRKSSDTEVVAAPDGRAEAPKKAPTQVTDSVRMRRVEEEIKRSKNADGLYDQ